MGVIHGFAGLPEAPPEVTLAGLSTPTSWHLDGDVPMRHREVGQLITRRDLVYLPGTATVRDASRLMADQGVGAVLVMEGSALQGIFTERDALNRVLAEDRDPDATQLSEVMTRNLVTLEPKAAAVDALRLMNEIGFRHLPVVEESHVFGIISLRDFIGAEFQQVCD